MRRSFLAAATALLLALGSPGSAHAGGFTGDAYSWMSTYCPPTVVTGQIDSLTVVPGVSSVFRGQLVACSDIETFEIFSIVFYRPSEVRGWAHPYLRSVSPAAPSFAVNVGLPSDTTAVCLLVSPTTRLDCRAIVFEVVNGQAVPRLGDPVPTDAPSVARPVTVPLKYSDDPGGGGPNCPTCWG
ncbi:hypothetical protein QEZ54_09395 [Catellatospora sp. KI3]|uniref:hypothetical protein n=1 Tax=Catellatospora sp. KI3 TaxID=3041620 RepID=UPI002482A1CD|nr:hypothetical protein [Catellatospora sp. KI3]MDI1461179.1 hypothetical protein [Catellatospora sp. KI3]